MNHITKCIQSASFLTRNKHYVRAFSGLTDDGKILNSWIKDDGQSLLDMQFDTIKVDKMEGREGIFNVQLNRPDKMNCMNAKMFEELKLAYEKINAQQEARVVVLSGSGSNFCTGMDLEVFQQLNIIQRMEPCPGRMSEKTRTVIKRFQDVISAPANCKVPVISAIDGFCIGAGVDMVAACDINLCTSGAKFSVKEVDLAIVADIGTLQRLPNKIGDQRSRELAFTGRVFGGEEAVKFGLAMESFSDAEKMNARALSLAQEIASKSPVTVRGIKSTLNFKLDNTVEDSLNQVADLNAAQIFSQDLMIAGKAYAKKEMPVYDRN